MLPIKRFANEDDLDEDDEDSDDEDDKCYN